jgi:hypothetical protein
MPCQVCNFINTTQSSVIRRTSVAEILAGKTHLPFTSRAAWLSIQAESFAQIYAGLTPIYDREHVLQRRLPTLQTLSITLMSPHGLLIVKRSEPLLPTRECIVVPRQVLDGLLTALHIQLNHPSAHQLKMVTRRYLFALDMDKAIERITDGCHRCASLPCLDVHIPQLS